MGGRFVMLRAAKAWGVLPSTVGLCAPDDDLAYMVAYVRAETTMQAVEQHQAEQEMKRRSRAKDRP